MLLNMNGYVLESEDYAAESNVDAVITSRAVNQNAYTLDIDVPNVTASRSVYFFWSVRSVAEIAIFADDLKAAQAALRSRDTDLRVRIFVSKGTATPVVDGFDVSTGRPQLPAIFKQISAFHPSESIRYGS